MCVWKKSSMVNHKSALGKVIIMVLLFGVGRRKCNLPKSMMIYVCQDIEEISIIRLLSKSTFKLSTLFSESAENMFWRWLLFFHYYLFLHLTIGPRKTHCQWHGLQIAGLSKQFKKKTCRADLATSIRNSCRLTDEENCLSLVMSVTVVQ